MTSAMFYLYQMDGYICQLRVIFYHLYFILRKNTLSSYADSVDLDQKPRFAAVDLSMLCLPMSCL